MEPSNLAAGAQQVKSTLESSSAPTAALVDTKSEASAIEKVKTRVVSTTFREAYPSGDSEMEPPNSAAGVQQVKSTPESSSASTSALVGTDLEPSSEDKVKMRDVSTIFRVASTSGDSPMEPLSPTARAQEQKDLDQTNTEITRLIPIPTASSVPSSSDITRHVESVIRNIFPFTQSGIAEQQTHILDPVTQEHLEESVDDWDMKYSVLDELDSDEVKNL